MPDSYEEGYHEDNGKAWSRLSWGDGGHKPGERFPTYLGNSEDAKLFEAINGRTEAEYLQGLLGSIEDTRSRQANPYRWKRFNPKKTDIYLAEKLRRSDYVTTSIYDPFAIPRDIDKEEFIEAYSAAAYASELGYVLNVSLTICWEMLGVKPKDSSRDELGLHELVIHPLRDWLKHKSNFYWLYSNEQSQRSGFHTHYLFHVPKEHADSFKSYIAKRMKKINKNPQFNTASFKLRFDKGMDPYKQWMRFQYLCKGINRNQYMEHITTGEQVYIEDLIRFKYENPGNNHAMRRIAHSQNLNKKARQASSFESALEKSILDINVLYPRRKFRPTERTDAEVWALLKNLQI